MEGLDSIERLTAPQPRVRSTAKGENRRRAIVNAAAELFDERGYHQTAVDDIAVGAGIKKASLYYHFRSKEEILFTVHEVYGREIVGRQELRREQQPRMSASDNLLELFKDMIGLLDRYPSHVRDFFQYERELAQSEFHETVKAKRDLFQSMVEDVVRGGIESGEFADVDVDLVVKCFFGMTNWTYRWYRAEGRLTSEEVARTFHRYFVQGIGSRSTDRGGDCECAHGS